MLVSFYIDMLEMFADCPCHKVRNEAKRGRLQCENSFWCWGIVRVICW